MGKIVRTIGCFVCILIMLMDIAAGILGIEAEMAQNKEEHLRLLIFECKQPSHQAYKFGFAAATLLVLAHVLANLVGASVCLGSSGEYNSSPTNRQLALACIIIAWILVFVGFGLLVTGTMSNSKSRASCGISHHRYFSIGGILCFVHGFFCVSFYVAAAAAAAARKA